jgi:hypothetical protein
MVSVELGLDAVGENQVEVLLLQALEKFLLIVATDDFTIDAVVDEQSVNKFTVLLGVLQMKNAECGLH